MHDQEPTFFYSIEALGLVGALIRTAVEAIDEQLVALREVEAAQMACVVDLETLERIEDLYTAVQSDADLYVEQLRRWRLGGLTSTEAEEVARLDQQVRRLREGAKELVAVGERLRMQLM